MKSKKMGKTGKLLSVLLALALLGMVPVVPAFAEEGELETQATAAEIVLQAQEDGSLYITNRWSGAVIVTQDQKDTTVSTGSTTAFTVSQNETITVRESTADTTFRSWVTVDGSPMKQFVQGVPCAITDMPAMPAFTTDKAGTIAGNAFFSNFNSGGSLTSLPEGSFDTSSITSTGAFFFSHFNSYGSLTSLPTGSFNTSGINTAGNYFFAYFNSFGGSLTSLPAGSFGTSSIKSAGRNFFGSFNWGGSLTSLPVGSFNTSGLESADNWFFGNFNYNGSLTSLPKGSFDTSGLKDAADNVFYGFNWHGALTSLPAGSFNTSGFTTVGDSFFSSFNRDGSLTSLPESSFDTSGCNVGPSGFFAQFNENGNLASLPRSFSLPKTMGTQVGTMLYCSNMFANSALTSGNRQVPLYFVASATDAFTGTDITPASPTAGTTVYVNGSDTTLPDREWPRLDGNKGDAGGRFDTMQAIVETGWKDTGSEYVVVAYGHDFPDALAASSLAGIYDAPVVLTDKGTLTEQARATIVGLNAKKAYIIGGNAVVSEEVAGSLAELLGGTANVERIAGENRFATALDIYREGSESTEGWGDTAIIANGFNFADALSVSPYANVMRYPIFLSTPDTRPGSGLDADTIAAINSGGFKKVIITGGTAAVPGIVEDQLASAGVTIERWMGDNRYETSVDIIEKSLQASGGALSLNNIICATGFNYPDALAGGAFAGHIGTVLLLIDDGKLREGGYAGLERIIRPHASEIGQGYVLGGEGALPADLLTLLQGGAKG